MNRAHAEAWSGCCSRSPRDTTRDGGNHRLEPSHGCSLADTATANTLNTNNTHEDETTGHGTTRSAGVRGEISVGAQNLPGESPGSNGSTRESPAARNTTRAENNDKKIAIQVASLNINGFGNLIRDHPDNKWGKVYQMMRDNRIGILLLQETHLTEDRKATIHKMFARKIKVFFSAHPDAPTQKEGVAIVLNARFLNTADATATEVVPGRALQISVQCQGGDTRNILCIYAPTSNGVDERRRFYKEVRKFYEENPDIPRPHLMAGDFNNVEDKVDRLPVNEEPDPSIIDLDDLKVTLGLMLADGWRATYPNTREYTFHRGSGPNAVFSRLDRIYVTPSVFDGAREWRVCEAGVRTDHSLVMVQLVSDKAPIVGAGRPLFPLQLLRDKKLAKAIKARGLAATRELIALEETGGRSADANPQIILYKLKTDAMRLAREREREVVPRLLAEIREGEISLRRLKADRNLPEQEKLAEAEVLTKQVRQLKQRRYRQQQQNSRATHRLYGDRPTKYWSKLHRECAPRDVINAFEKEGQLGAAGEKLYESDSSRMADMARTHHMNVQRDDPRTKTAEEREHDIVVSLDSLHEKVTEEQAAALGGRLTYDDCATSLRLAKNGTAPGLDGLPFEFWKVLHARYTEDSRFPDRTHFDVVRLLTAAFEDIRTYGVSPKTAFAHGWIAPIYKEKGERSRVVNYRPITLLNTDYKILSKALAVRLADVAPIIIHRAQAGFVPGRKIHNHTQLARLMMSWAELNESNGAIVALDQEKAYDKIAHDYLWRVLQRFGIPDTFINIVKSLYENAETSIMVNGVLSRAYRVYRGVRQGDPLSCLLFDLAIEPLSAMIRGSDIEGFTIPRCDEVLKAVLFADDTTVYLSSRDDFNTLQAVLDTWCAAAKARFNMAKTEIIPLGTPEYRSEMAETYRLSGAWKNYPQGVHIAQEGEAVRILGAFFGNGVDQTDIWTLVLTKIVAMRKPLMHAIARWKNGHATLQGKKHVIQMIVGGMTQFFTTVQRMPEIILKRLTKIIRGYLWDDRSNTPVGIEHVCLPVQLGGLGILDLEARSDAIDVMWLKSYLDFSDDRPIWASLADDIFASHVPKDCRPKAKDLRVNSFIQRWKPKVRGLPAELEGMMKVAKTYGVRLEGIAFSKSLLKSMMLWDHVNADKKKLGRLTVPSKLLTCLQTNHRARTVGDFISLAEILGRPAHKPKASCKCSRCSQLRTTINCENPHLCATRAKEMISTLHHKWNPLLSQPEDYENATMNALLEGNSDRELIPFDRRVTTHGDIGQAFRIFTDEAPVSNDTVSMTLNEDGSQLVIATDGSCLRNGERNAQAGAGVFVEADHQRNQSLRLPAGLEQSNQTGECVAAMLAASTAGSRTRVIQETDSQTVLRSLTKWKQRHEDTGYIRQKNAKLTQVTIARLRMRQAHTLFRWVKGHDGHPRNEAADVLAGIGARKTTSDQLDLSIPPQYAVSGAKLQAMTQALAYHAIRARKAEKISQRPRATANMDRIASGIEAAYDVQLHDETIWLSFRAKHIARPASQFIWMAVHDGYMLGTHWLRPKMSLELQMRANCAICGERETMTHVIFECKAKGQEIIWTLLEQVWSHTGEVWKRPSWGTTFGAACAVIKTTGGHRKPAAEALWCILCTEALHLVWKLRCERVIQKDGADFTANEVTNRFYSTIDSRLNLDRRTAAISRGKRSLKPQDVERIWLPVIEDGSDLPPKWVVNNGVLVGIKRGR